MDGMLRDTSGRRGRAGAGILATEPVAPAPIRAQVTALAARIRRRANGSRRAARVRRRPPTPPPTWSWPRCCWPPSSRPATWASCWAPWPRPPAHTRACGCGSPPGGPGSAPRSGSSSPPPWRWCSGLLACSRAFLQPYDTAAGQLVLLRSAACSPPRSGWLRTIAAGSANRRVPHPARRPRPPARGAVVTAALCAGGGFGLGLLAIASGLAPAPGRLAAALAALTRHPARPCVHAGRRRVGGPDGPPVAAAAGRHRPAQRPCAADLAMLGRPPAGSSPSRPPPPSPGCCSPRPRPVCWRSAGSEPGLAAARRRRDRARGAGFVLPGAGRPRRGRRPPRGRPGTPWRRSWTWS